MASQYRRMHGMSLPLLFLFLCSWQQQVAQAAAPRKIQISKLPNRLLMMTSAQYSTPSFYNAFDPAFQNHASMYSPNHDQDSSLHHEQDSSLSTNYDKSINKESLDLSSNPTKESVEFNDNVNKGIINHNYEAHLNNQQLGASLDSAHDASHPSTFSNNYDHDNFAASTLDHKPSYRDNFKYPSFSVPSTRSQSLYGRKFPASFEAPFLNKESFNGQDDPFSRGQQGLYTSSPSSEQQNLYGSPSSEKSSLYTSSSNEQTSYSSSPSSYYKASYPFASANHSPSNKPKVSEFNEFTQSHPVLSYDSFFNKPTVNTNVVHTAPLGRTTFPMSDHDLTYGQVRVP